MNKMLMQNQAFNNEEDQNDSSIDHMNPISNDQTESNNFL